MTDSQDAAGKLLEFCQKRYDANSSTLYRTQWALAVCVRALSILSTDRDQIIANYAKATLEAAARKIL